MKPKRPDISMALADIASLAQPQRDNAIASSLLNEETSPPDNATTLQRDSGTTPPRDDVAGLLRDDASPLQRDNAEAASGDSAGTSNNDNAVTSSRDSAATPPRRRAAASQPDDVKDLLSDIRPLPDRGVKRRMREERPHTSIYLHPDVMDLIKIIAIKERIKAHDILVEGVRLALKKRGHDMDKVAAGQGG